MFKGKEILHYRQAHRLTRILKVKIFKWFTEPHAWHLRNNGLQNPMLGIYVIQVGVDNLRC